MCDRGLCTKLCLEASFLVSGTKHFVCLKSAVLFFNNDVRNNNGEKGAHVEKYHLNLQLCATDAVL